MQPNFEEIYCKYYSSIYRYIFNLSKNSDIAEEITQETFYKALKNIDKYDENYKLLTWLCGIAKNTYYSMYRKKRRMQEFPKDITDDSEFIDSIIDTETNIELLKILHKLEEPYKEVFTLRIYGNLSFKNIGEIFGKSETWARVTFYRSKIKIKEDLK